MSCRLKEHIVEESNYKLHKRKKIENTKDVDRGLDVSLSVNALVPKESTNNDIIIKSHFTFGNDDAQMILALKTVAYMEYDDVEYEELDKEYLGKECLPIVLKDIRDIVKNITVAYGIEPLELPPFEPEVEH